ncbi:hypothetical protein G9A89_023914 [Geosiphon pyriformis]|nr:hypothetical protein G9A89_023914 [Geosiphon pyriformis]
MKKAAEKSGAGGSFKPVLPRKKRKSVALEEDISRKGVPTEVPNGRLWSFETGNTTKSKNIDIEKKCLVEETSFDFGKNGTMADMDHNQTSKGPSMITKKALGKPLGKIDFSDHGNNDDILFDVLLELPLSLKNLVSISVRKSFALDIGLDKVVGKSSQEKLMVVRKLFSRVNGFGGASTSSKFSEIICTFFTSESSLAQATKKARVANILVNINLKKSTGHSDQAVIVKKIPVGTSTETVHAVLSMFGINESIKMQLVRLWQKAIVEFGEIDQADLAAARWSILIEKDAVCVAKTNNDKESWDARNHHRALLYTLPMGTTAHDIWNFVGSVGRKTCMIDHHPVMYAWARCAIVCFNLADSLDAVMDTTSVLRGVNLCWSCLSLSKCVKCGNLDHTSLGCSVNRNLFSGRSSRRMLSDVDKSRLAAIYAKRSALVTQPVAFGGALWASVVGGSSFPPLSGQSISSKNGFFSEIKPTPLLSLEMNNRFATLEHSLASLAEHVDKLAKRLDTPGPMVSQFRADIVMSESLGVATSGETVVGVVVFNPSIVLKMEETLKNLLVIVMNFSAKLDNAGQKLAMCNVQGMNNQAKQEDIIY